MPSISQSIYHLKLISKNAFLLLGVVVLLYSCGGQSTEVNCQYDNPAPVFANIQGLENHNFEATGQSSKEFVSVPPLAMNIELYQSGCNSLEQEFRFLLNGTMPKGMPPSVCATELASIFYSLSQLDAKLMNFGGFAQAFTKTKDKFRYNEPVALTGSDITAKIIKQDQPKSTILTVIFSTQK